MTDNIKMPSPKFLYDEEMGELHDPGDYAPSDCVALYTSDQVHEAVRLNAQADIRTLIADDAYAMTFQSLGQYRSALLSALSAAPQPAQQPLTDEQFQKIRRSLMQQSGWDGDGWDQALKEAIEQAHGIGGKA